MPLFEQRWCKVCILFQAHTYTDSIHAVVKGAFDEHLRDFLALEVRVNLVECHARIVDAKCHIPSHSVTANLEQTAT